MATFKAHELASHQDDSVPPTVALPTPVVDSKEAVLDAAQRLINQYGYAGFSMRDLAQQSGLAKATLYHHFTDKREIFFQVLQRDLTIVRNHLEAAAATPGDVVTRLRAVTRAFFVLGQDRGLLLLSNLRQTAGMDEEFCRLIRDYRNELHRPIVTLLQEGIADGTVRPISAELATMSYFGILQVFVSRHLIMQDFELDEAAVEFVLDFTLHGVMAKSPHADNRNEHP